MRTRVSSSALAFALALVTLAGCGVDERPLPDPPDDGGDDATLACGLPPVFSNRLLVYGSDDGACARVERRDLSEPDIFYKAIPYEALRVAVVVDGIAIDVVDASALDYVPSHHNWEDEATAASDGLIARVRILYRSLEDREELELTILDAALDDDEREEAPIAGPKLIARW